MKHSDESVLSSVQRRIYEIVEAASEGDRTSHVFDVAILTLIIANVIATIAETVPSLEARYRGAFSALETACIAIFTIEYLARLWSVTSSPRFSGTVVGRLRFMKTPLAIIDLLAILPFYVAVAAGLDLDVVRMLRLFRLFRLLKLARYVKSVQTLVDVVHAKKEELLVAITFALVLLVFASSLLYFAENDAQPQVFSSIPASMWWGVCTLTTVGYGDIYPITPLGRFFGGSISLIGIGVFALPAGILASGFTERLARAQVHTCPHCGSQSGPGAGAAKPAPPSTEAS